jgi:hypothetical protein
MARATAVHRRTIKLGLGEEGQGRITKTMFRLKFL